MSLLFNNLRVHQTFGANTGVGKTILTIALSRAAAALSRDVFYLKPISTGPLESADQSTVKRHALKVKADYLYQFDHPVSPHLAAELSKEKTIPSDASVVNAISSYIRRCASQCSHPSNIFVETAGGVHSPTLLGTPQLDLYRPLLLPTILIGDSKLGGISSTVSAFESLLLRGYTVDLVLLFRDEYYRNWEYLTRYFQNNHGIAVHTVPSPPPLVSNPEENFAFTEKYFESIQHNVSQFLGSLDHLHQSRLEELSSMPQRTLDSIWWPFVQHGMVKSTADVTTIDSAHSDFFNVTSSEGPSVLEPQLDGSASWWTQCLGHAHPALTLAAARAAGRYGHVLFPQATHLPALRLAETMIHDGPGKGWASRAFFSDDGSTGMEVALKMAMRYHTSSSQLDPDSRRNLGILGLKGSYHGDTIGAMDATEKSGVYTCEWHQGKGYWIDAPTVSIQDGVVGVDVPSSLQKTSALRTTHPSLSGVYDVESRLDSPLAYSYSNYLKKTISELENSGSYKISALVLEPLVMGAGGMMFIDPLFQRILVDTVRSCLPDVPVIFDEVFVGLYRLGLTSSTDILKIHPDIAVYAKILTGGLVPMAVTLASSKIFNAFSSDNKADALLHGHSYTANPLSCEVANETWKIMDHLKETSDEWKAARTRWKPDMGDVDARVWSFWDPGFIDALSRLPVVAEVMTLGTVLAFKVKSENEGYTSSSAQQLLQNVRRASTRSTTQQASSAPGGVPFGLHYRTLGDVAYLMTSLNTSSEVIREVEDKVWHALSSSVP